MTTLSFHHYSIGRRYIENTGSNTLRNKSLIHKFKSKQKLVSIIWISTLILFVLSCIKRNEFAYPLIQTGEVTDIDSTGAMFHAKFIDLSKEDILEYGFVWGLEQEPDLNSAKIILTGDPEYGTISYRISTDLVRDKVYYVRAFARNEKYVTYGKVVSFKSKGSSIPEIYDFDPKEGSGGTKVIITGKYFSADIHGNTVIFGKATARIDAASTDKLEVTLPEDLNVSGTVNITIESANNTCRSDATFYLLGCDILDFKPRKLMIGDVIRIAASNYGTGISDNLVTIGGAEAEIISQANDTIMAYVPYNPYLGNKEITLTVNGKTCYARDSVFLENPWNKIVNEQIFVRQGSIGFAIEGKGYIGLGIYFGNNGNYFIYKDLWEYNIENNSWKKCAVFPGLGRSNAVAFSIGGKGYVGLGSYYNDGSNFSTDFYEYDPLNNTWKQKAEFPGEGRFNPFNLVIGKKGYVGCGQGISALLSDIWEYDPETDKWTRLNDFPGYGDFSCYGFAVNDMAYIGNQFGFWRYDVSNNSWSKIDFPGLFAKVGFSIGGFGYAGFGLSCDPGINDLWRYDPQNDKWSRLADAPFGPRCEPACFVIDKKVYFSSGYIYQDLPGIFQESLIEFDPKK
jgi:N-acetylneuraminic acid mutarotase